MRKSLLLVAAATMFYNVAMAETATFDFTADNPYNWNSLPKDASGYIDDSAKPLKITESPVTITLDGKFRRLAQNVFGGTTCLLIYKDTSLTLTSEKGYKMTDISIYSGTDKITDLYVSAGEAELGEQEPTGGDGWNHATSGAHIDEIYRMAYCNTAGPIVIGDNGSTQVVTKIEVSYEATSLLEAGLEWSAREFTAYMGESNAFPSLTKVTDAVVDYTSDNEDVATVDEAGNITLVGPGTTKIIAGCDATSKYDWGEASYTLIVKRQGQRTATFDFTTFEAIDGSDKECIADFPEILVGTWWTTNPDTSYGSGTQFKPLTITDEGVEITFNYDGSGGHGNVRGTTTTKQNNLQLGGSSCMTIKGTETGSELYEVAVQGNRKRTAEGLSFLADMTTDDNGTIEFDESTQLLTWTPAKTGGVCYLDAREGAYIESITVEYRGAGAGVDNVAVENNTDAPVEYYNIQGVRVSNPEKGLYIRRQGTKVNKIVIR